MKTINITVMGKTGAGKSTLINAVLGEELATTGIGKATTQENKLYSKKIMLSLRDHIDGQYRMIGRNLNIYDTVGLEIDNAITESTLKEIKKHIAATSAQMQTEDIHLVWFCINHKSNRFESYELELIKKLSIDYEIPFIIVMTQCYSEDEGTLERQIKDNLEEVLCKTVLAKDYKTRFGCITAYGIDDLLNTSIDDYKKLKVQILEKKLLTLDESRNIRVHTLENKGKSIISTYVSNATKIGFIPGGCIPFVHGMCIKMIADLNNLAGIKLNKHFAEDLFSDFIVGLIATPMMVVPFLSAAAACAYVQQVGDDYLKALMQVIHLSSDSELKDLAYVRKRIKEELENVTKS